MKKLLLIALMATTLGLNAQVKSVTLDSTKAIIGGGNIHYSVVTTNPTDTFYTKVEVSDSVTFTSPFYTPFWVQHIGSGLFMQTIGKPLVDTLVLSYVRIIATDDTTKSGMKSNNLSLTPKHEVLKPTIYSISLNTTTSGMTEKIGYTNGYADSSVIKCEIALDSMFVYKTNTKTWSVYLDGSLTYSVSGLKDNKQFFTRWTITNTGGSNVIKSSFTTVSNAAKIWLRKPADTVKVTSFACDIKGRAISYGLTGTIWATINGVTVSNIFSLTGVGEEWYVLSVTGLNQSTNYVIWIHGKNAKGEDSFSLSITTTKYFNPKFFVYTDMTVGVSDGTAEVWGSYNIPQGQIGNITIGLFAENDSLCTVTLQDSTYYVNEGSGYLYKRFYGLELGKTYWAWYWGTCSDGQYDLTPAPLKIIIPFSVGTEDIEKNKISIYPNPASDFLHLSSSDSYVIHNAMGQIVLTGTGSDIDVRQLKTGMYTIKTPTGYARFQKI